MHQDVYNRCRRVGCACSEVALGVSPSSDVRLLLVRGLLCDGVTGSCGKAGHSSFCAEHPTSEKILQI